MDALLDDVDDSLDEDEEFKINTSYANKYDTWRAKEEHQKLKDKYGDDVTAGHSSDSSSESEDDETELEKVVDKQFLTTLSMLKSKDPRIYKQDVDFFPSEVVKEEKSSKTKTKKAKPMFLRDYEREMILKNGGDLLEDESFPEEISEDGPPKESFQTFLQDSDNDEDDLLVEKSKTEEQQAAEEEEYMKWLKGNKEEGKVEELRYLKEYWNQPQLEEGEAFLRDYILERQYLHEDGDGPPLDSLSEDEEELDKQEMFEHKYNFRFEEPDPEFIQRFPRTMKDSMRRKDDRRKAKRDEQKERKKQEKDRKKEEIKRMKALKRKEIMEKLDRLKQITGNDRMGFDGDDLDGDFDPEQYDRRMKELFDDDYYAAADEEKPECAGEAELVGNRLDEELHCEDPGFNMDAEYDPNEARTSKSKTRFAQAISKKKPLFDPGERSFEKYFDEYYGLDFEDIVGDMPVRFRYREVVPNDFGLSTEEVLGANDKELNRWCSLKKTCQYRTEEEERYDLQAFQKKSQNQNLKEKVLSSIYSQGEPSEASTSTQQKKRKLQQTEAETAVSDERLKAYGINPKKYKNKLKYKTQT